MIAPQQNAKLKTEAWKCLGEVNDPELDEPVTDMGFIEDLRVCDETRNVEVDFRLPTYWCSPNFAFLMAIDIRVALENLDWTEKVLVTLHDHCFDDRVNQGVNGSRDFGDVFAEYCDGADLNLVRQTFLEKAFVRRQETVLLGLETRGFTGEEIVAMDLETFDGITFEGEEESKQKPRYRALLLSQGLAQKPGDLAFRTWDGVPLTADGLRGYLARLRGVRINMEFNGALCRGLQSTRYKEVQIGEDGPTLIDFIHDRVPPRHTPDPTTGAAT